MSECTSIAQNSIIEVSNQCIEQNDYSVHSPEVPSNSFEINTNNFRTKLPDSEASFDFTDSFQFNRKDNNFYTTLAMVVKAPKEMENRVKSLFSQKFSLALRPAFDLKTCDVVIKWGAANDFLFEVNAELIKSIFLLERFVFKAKETLNMPIIFSSGDKISTHFIEITQKEYGHLESLVNVINEFWTSDYLSENDKKKYSVLYTALKKIGVNQLHGQLGKKYLRPTTVFDIIEH